MKASESLSDTTTSESSDSLTEGQLVSAMKKNSSKEGKRVSFGSLVIHEHGMILGGSGVPRTGGAPLALEWERQEQAEHAQRGTAEPQVCVAAQARR